MGGFGGSRLPENRAWRGLAGGIGGWNVGIGGEVGRWIGRGVVELGCGDVRGLM